MGKASEGTGGRSQAVQILMRSERLEKARWVGHGNNNEQVIVPVIGYRAGDIYRHRRGSDVYGGVVPLLKFRSIITAVFSLGHYYV